MDWKLCLFIVSLIKDFILVLGIILIKINDLKHLTNAVIKLEKCFTGLKEEFIRFGNKLIEIETRCEERHSK